jgi:4'-phosphopantetheinyl transferase
MQAAADPDDRLRSLATELHVRHARTGAVDDPGCRTACRALLSGDEGRRLDRLRREPDRRAFLVAHALLRLMLSRYADVPPASWTFSANRWGRPEIAGPAAAPALRFSLSHTAGLVACAVARDGDCGLDVEACDRTGDLLMVARRVLSESELADLENTPAAARRERFLTYWTLKEAYVKARGMGLSLPLRAISFSLAGAHIRIASEVPGDAAADRWSFTSMRPTQRHLLAVAQRGDGPTRTLIVREGLPTDGTAEL